jgi:hypothetical protein
MEQTFIKYIYTFFRKLIETYKFKIRTELNEGDFYMIEYSSDNFVIKIEKYFREFYVTFHKTNSPNSEINLFNLLDYLKNGDEQIVKSEYFHNEKEVNECYKKQFAHLSSTIYNNYELISDFFSEEKHELNMIKFEKYWKSKYPNFYNKI